MEIGQAATQDESEGPSFAAFISCCTVKPHPYLSETARLGKQALPAEWVLMAVFGGVMLATGAYEPLHRDEFLYAAYGDHPSLGYKEAAPLIGWAATLSETLLGKTAFALRLWPSLCMVAALAVYLRLMRLLGASLSARLWFGIAYALSPVIIAFGHLFQPSGFEVLAYAMLTYAWVEALARPKAHLGWVLLATAGGLYAKFSFLLSGGQRSGRMHTYAGHPPAALPYRLGLVGDIPFATCTLGDLATDARLAFSSTHEGTRRHPAAPSQTLGLAPGSATTLLTWSFAPL